MSDISISLDTAGTQVVPPAPRRERRHLLTEIPGLPDHYLLVLDNTAAEKILTCHRAAQYYLFYERQAHAKDAALVFGGAIHEGLKALLLEESDEVQNLEVIRYFTENPSPPDEYRTVNNALTVLSEYRKRSGLPDYRWEILGDAHGPIVERPFELPLGVIRVEAEIQLPSWGGPRYVHTIHIAWSGRIDTAAHCNQRNRVVDHKTSKIDGDQFTQSFLLANQTIGYVRSARILWPELNVSGFCLNCIRLKPPAKGLSLTDKGPRGGEPALKFFRCYYDYSPERVVQWEKNTLMWISDFVHSLVRGYFPMQTTACFGRYGRCQYHDVCTMENEEVALRYLMGSAYRQVTWDPTL